MNENEQLAINIVKAGEIQRKQRLEEFEVEARKIMEEAITLLVNKRKDYGNNALKGGIYGITIRMSDKMGRLENLLGIENETFKSKEAIIGDEKIEDTFRDLINYGILALLESRKMK